MNELFNERVKEYFKDKANDYLTSLSKPCSQAFFLNTKKDSKDNLLKTIDFDYRESILTNNSFYHNYDNIGKTKAYELGLIYPQEIAASLTTSFINPKDLHLIVDFCAAPGGKSINVLNQVSDDCLLISNDVNHKRVLTLSSNLERCGFENVIITNKETSVLANQLKGCADLVVLDAPCSGEGMIRKYPEILDNYSLNNINSLASIQSDLLENAYSLLKENGQLVYSTCTYAFEEDEDQIKDFLSKHQDMQLIPLDIKDNQSTLPGTIKLSPLNDTEGQFICLMKKMFKSDSINIKYLKPIKEKIVDDFIKDNINIDNYYLYKHNDYYYLSLIPLCDLGNNVIRYGVQVGQIVNKRFEPSHSLYRSNKLDFKYRYDIDENEYSSFIQGLELKANLDNHYYQVTYKNYPLGFGKVSNNVLKNKYPKGLRY